MTFLKKSPMINDIQASKMTVNITSDLNLFTPIEGNRPVNPQHVKRLTQSIREYGMLVNPILVNEKYNVIDGQHRLEAAKRANSSIYYIVVDDYGLNQVHALNLNQKNWTTKDFLKGYTLMGIEPYIKLTEFMEKNSNYGIGDCIKMCSNNSHNRGYSAAKRDNYKKVFNEGTWATGDMTVAQKWAEDINLISTYYDGYNRSVFVSTMITMFNHEYFDFNEFMQKLRFQPTALVHCANMIQYKALIEDIYNFKRRNKVSLRY